jgi:hypothetical protein
MRKLAVTVTLFALCAVSLAAQEVSVTPASTEVSLLNVNNYSSYFVNGNGTVAGKYGRVLYSFRPEDHNTLYTRLQNIE